jgi:hypothetical protein
MEIKEQKLEKIIDCAESITKYYRKKGHKVFMKKNFKEKNAEVYILNQELLSDFYSTEYFLVAYFGENLVIKKSTKFVDIKGLF